MGCLGGRGEAVKLTGGCLCGSVRYEVDGKGHGTTLCHCEDCRKASGAHAVAWTFFRKGALRWTRGEPKVVEFAGRERTFCGGCGTPLMFYDPGLPEIFEVSTCSLDRADEFAPGDQCWLDDALGWSHELADLPRYEETAPLPGGILPG